MPYGHAHGSPVVGGRRVRACVSACSGRLSELVVVFVCLSESECVCVYVCMCVLVCLSVLVCPFVCLSASYVCVCLSVSFVCVSLSVCLFVNECVRVCVSLSVFVCRSQCMCVCVCAKSRLYPLT